MAHDGAHMNVADTTKAMGSFSEAGSTFTSEWSGALGMIEENAGRLGGGPLGAAFMGKYRGSATATARQATEAAHVPEEFSAAGMDSAGYYERGDEAARGAMPTAPPAAGPRPR